MAGMSAGQPPKCTTDMAFVRGVISGAMVSAVIAPELGSTSAKIALHKKHGTGGGGDETAQLW